MCERVHTREFKLEVSQEITRGEKRSRAVPARGAMVARA